ncbi:MAG: hypothetical protein ACK5CM_05550, partial [Pseudanabaena sp.]
LKKAKSIEETIQQLQILLDELRPLISHCESNIECKDCTREEQHCSVLEDPRYEFHQACSTWQGSSDTQHISNLDREKSSNTL